MKLKVGIGPDQGRTQTVSVVCDQGTDWPVLSGQPDSEGNWTRCIILDPVHGSVAPDPHALGWPDVFIRILRVVASNGFFLDPDNFDLPKRILGEAIAPIAGTILVGHSMPDNVPVNPVVRIADALRDVGFDVELAE